MSKRKIADPSWCAYPSPARPGVGCWSLLNGQIKAPDDCGSCECRIIPAPPQPREE